MIEQSGLLAQQLLSLSDVAKRIPSRRRNGHLSAQAVWRWASKGIRLTDGQIVKLRTVRIAGRYMTTASYVDEFIRAQQSEPIESAPLPERRTPSQRQRADARAADLLTEAGI